TWNLSQGTLHFKLGNVLVALGDPVAALDEYRRCVTSREALVARDGRNIEWQRLLSSSYDSLGSGHLALNNLPDALEAYRRRLEIAQALVKLDDVNAEW